MHGVRPSTRKRLINLTPIDRVVVSISLGDLHVLRNVGIWVNGIFFLTARCRNFGLNEK